ERPCAGGLECSCITCTLPCGVSTLIRYTLVCPRDTVSAARICPRVWCCTCLTACSRLAGWEAGGGAERGGLADAATAPAIRAPASSMEKIRDFMAVAGLVQNFNPRSSGHPLNSC